MSCPHGIVNGWLVSVSPSSSERFVLGLQEV